MYLSFKTGAGIDFNTESLPYHATGDYEMYKIVSPNTLLGYTLKIFLNLDTTSPELVDKLKYIVGKRPKEFNDQDSVFYCWPKDIVFHEQNFIGVISPEIQTNTISLRELCIEVINTKDENWIIKFNRDDNSTFQRRIDLCCLLCVAIENIISFNKVVTIDLHP